jgi:D-glycero-D-manno-heptose 1,7-bisphosphate phosphatase
VNVRKFPAVFLDRDGVIIAEKTFQINPNGIELIPRSVEGLQKLSGEFLKVVVSNQSGIARGYFKRPQVLLFQNALGKRLWEKGISIAAWYFCPHGPSDGCDCRKPKPGLILRAAKELPINLAGSWMVGDKSSDIEAGKSAGLKTILVQTGYAGKEDGATAIKPDFIVDDLFQAVDIINRG